MLGASTNGCKRRYWAPNLGGSSLPLHIALRQRHPRKRGERVTVSPLLAMRFCSTCSRCEALPEAEKSGIDRRIVLLIDIDQRVVNSGDLISVWL